MPGDLRQLQHEVGRWKAQWEMVNVAKRPNTHDTVKSILSSIQHVYNSCDTAGDVCLDCHSRAIVQCHATPQELSVPCMVTSERLSGLDMHVHNDKMDAERVIHQSSHLALTFHPNEREGSN